MHTCTLSRTVLTSPYFSNLCPLTSTQVKAFTEVLKEKEADSVGIDLVVHSTCKLLGHLGSHLEYGRGVQAFPEHLQALLDKAREVGDTEEEELERLRASLDVKLARQVRSRYFVTSRNAGRLFFLAPLAVGYISTLELTKELNNLEKDMLAHMKRPQDLAMLEADGLFFDQVYADLMTLLKSSFLGTKYLDMNIHYKELLEYLTILSHTPRLCFDPSRKVFASEDRLYSDDRVNDRAHTKYAAVRQCLYEHEYDDKLTFPLVQRAAQYMVEKLQSYKGDQLPGGKLWSPSETIKKALANVDPTNDLCESILGLNDWLQKVTPNFNQRTVTGMVELMKNSMSWFTQQDKEMRDKIINLARKHSKRVKQEDRELAEQRRLKRKRAREVEVEKGKARQLKRMRRQKELEETRLLTTAEDVEEALTSVPGRTAKQVETAKVELLRKQLQLQNPTKRIVVTVKKTSEELLQEEEIEVEAMLIEVQHKLRDEDTE